MSLSKIIDLSNSSWGIIPNWSASAGCLIQELSNSATLVFKIDDTVIQYEFTKIYIGYEIATASTASTTVRESEDSIVVWREGAIPNMITAPIEFYIYFGTVPKGEDVKKLQEWLERYYAITEGGVYHKFTKLYDSETVATSGNKCFRKLTNQPRLTAPTISIEGTTLTITDNEGKATRYDIYVDGVFTTNIGVKTYECLLLGLDEGTYSISVIGKANGYINSKESNVATLEIAKVESDGYTVTIINNSSMSGALEVYDGADSSGVLLGSVGKGETRDFKISSGQMATGSYGASNLISHSETGGVKFEEYNFVNVRYSVTGDGTVTIQFGSWD